MQHLQPNTTLQGGKYRIERVLGQGGFGITYLAVQVCSNINYHPPMLPYYEKHMAIKELFIGGSGQAINDRRGNQVIVTNSANQASFEQQRQKFEKEAKRLSNLNHPNIVKVYDLFEENGTAYYVMDYIDGETLRTKLNRQGCLSEKEVFKYIQQILPALEIAHKQNIWHLDIKPENIIVDRDGNAYLIDFGASKHIAQNGTLTTSLALAYTKGYCPPELADLTYGNQDSFVQALKEIGPWTDIYALGATLYNLLTDNIPPSSNRLYREGRNAFMFPVDISSSTRDLIIWMMMPNMEDRPQSILDLTNCFVREDTILLSKERTPRTVNFVLLDKEKNKESETTKVIAHDRLVDYYEIYELNNITWNYDVINRNLVNNDKFVEHLNSQHGLFVEDISKATKCSIGIILLNLGWLMKEGRLDYNWSCCTRCTQTCINGDLAGFSASNVFHVLSMSGPSAKSIKEIIKLADILTGISVEETMLGLGWLMKEGKLLFEKNLISLA